MDKVRYPKVSFIIPTLNEEKNIARCLLAIKTQDYPQDRIEIIIADAYSKDKTRSVAKKFGAIVIDNPEVLHEQGKTRAMAKATGAIIFFTDADNVLSTNKWLIYMTKPYIDDPSIIGFLPQTEAPKDTNILDRYLGMLATDPFTWFMYGNATSPRDYGSLYHPIKQTANYLIYNFPIKNHPLLGTAQGFGVNTKLFTRNTKTKGDDILAGIDIIERGGTIAYIPKAGIYHYHVSSFGNYIRKYSWRVKNNLKRVYKETGLVNRMKYHSLIRKLRMALFIPYSLSIVFPFIDAIRLSLKHRDPVMLIHVPATILMAYIIIKEYILHIIGYHSTLGTYE
jgi:glycosyltransferase involved in cell wall biosynthesis